jgi:hypothetical protein
MALSHLEIYILVHLTGNEDVMLDAFLIVRECTPKIPVECLEEGKCRTVKATVKVRRRAQERNSFHAQCRACAGTGRDESEGDMRYCRMVVG